MVKNESKPRIVEFGLTVKAKSFVEGAVENPNQLQTPLIPAISITASARPRVVADEELPAVAAESERGAVHAVELALSPDLALALPEHGAGGYDSVLVLSSATAFGNPMTGNPKFSDSIPNSPRHAAKAPPTPSRASARLAA
ncbi:MAG: hypothetical protein VBE63_27480 [Lamprobacter sp.]|uniref:hypothetical protein n=1 Tax=Lamprobacter sp. TaxID=3100796 RepID=UPI002B25C2C3|nr:hypothetical protein [Lamprobacter sp.]MEA3643640.1 hypothetical protein [Lamprobacter sp.]